MNKHLIIEKLSLEPHPSEGGYFRRSYESEVSVPVPYSEAQRHSMTSIYYLLTDDSPVGYLHRNQADIVHYFHAGSPITYFVIHPDGCIEEAIMGADIECGQKLQLTVKRGCWKASQLLAGEFGLISEAVTPGFDYQDNEIASKVMVDKLFPQHIPQLSALIKS